jgi:flagellar motor switch protein FliG
LLLDRILQGSDVSGLEALKWMDPQSVAELLRNEHPQIVAAILVHLEYDQAADVLKNLTERQRNEVMLRVATMEGIQPTALKDLNEVLFRVLAGGDKIRKASLGGIKTAAEMINLMGTAIEGTVIESIRSHDADLAQKIMDKMFVFDDVLKLDDKAIQKVLREVDTAELSKALKSVDSEVQDKIYRNMSKRAASLLKEDMEFMGPTRRKDVEESQQKIVAVIRKLEEAGEVVIARSGEEDVLV